MNDQQHHPCDHCGWLVIDDLEACPRCGHESSAKVRSDYHAIVIAVAIAIAVATFLIAI